MNYENVLAEELEKIKKLDYTPSLLLHACCAPCSSYVLEYLSKYFNITIYYYNPNIYPFLEYDRRLNELKKFLSEYKGVNKIDLIETNYDTNAYDKSVLGSEEMGERSIRCYKCYYFRMEESIKYACKHNFDYFTTTLSISPYKNASWINEIGSILEGKYGVKFLYSDFKKKNGYKRSLELSREYNLYRQDYCGCKYSKKERGL